MAYFPCSKFDETNFLLAFQDQDNPASYTTTELDAIASASPGIPNGTQAFDVTLNVMKYWDAIAQAWQVYKTSGTGANSFACQATLSAPQSIAPSTATLIAFNSTNYNYGGEFNTSTNTFTALVAGVRTLSAMVSVLTALSESASFNIFITKNGASLPQANFQDVLQATQQKTTLCGSCDINLAVGDTLQAFVAHDFGSSVQIGTNGSVQGTFLSIKL